MKTSQITQRTLIETFIRDNDPVTANYLRVMNENFVIPFNKSLLSLNLMEAEMTAQQIQNAFGAAERIATAGGDNRNLLGKGADVAGAAASAAGKGAVALGKGAADLAVKGAKGAKELVNKLLTQKKQEFEQNLPPVDAGPVQNFEQQATQAAEQVEDPKAKKSLMDMVKQGIKNPVAQTMLLTAITGIAGVVAAPAIASLGLGGVAASTAIGAIVGGLSGVVRAKMQGSDWKEAGKQGLKGAGLGAAAGLVGGGIAQAGQAIAQHFTGGQQPAAGTEQPAADGAPVQGRSIGVGKELPDGSTIKSMDGNKIEIARPDGSTMVADRETAMAMANPGVGQFGKPLPAGGTTSNDSVADQMASYFNSHKDEHLDDAGIWVPNNPAPAETPTTPAAAEAPITPRLPPGASMSDFSNTAPAAQPGETPAYTPTGNAYIDKLNQAAANGIRLRGIQRQSKVNTGNPVIEYIDKELTARMWILHESVGKPRGGVHLTEAGIGDMFKKAGNWLKTKAGNLTNKVTADKLQQAWAKAGNPTDSGQVASIMTQAGVPQETIDQVFKNLGLPQGSSTPIQPQQQPAQQPAPATQQPAPATQQPAPATQQPTNSAGVSQSYRDKLGTAVSSAGNKLAKATGSLQGAVQAGTGMGATGQSLMYPKAGDDVQRVKDSQGKEHQYKKVGDQWVNMADNTPVDPATAAMLNKQSKQAAAAAPAQQTPAQSSGKDVQGRIAKQLSTAPSAPAQPIKIGGQTLDPNDPADAKIIAQVQKQQGAPAATNNTPSAATEQPATVQPAPAQPTAAPAQQSPEEIRKQKQAAAAKAAQAQMTPKTGPAQAPSAGQQMPGYGKVTYNVPTRVPQVPKAQPTTGAKAVLQQPAQSFGSRGIAGMDAAPSPAQSAPAQEVPGFLQSKLKGRQPVAASTDFSAMLARKAKIRL